MRMTAESSGAQPMERGRKSSKIFHSTRREPRRRGERRGDVGPVVEKGFISAYEKLKRVKGPESKLLERAQEGATSRAGHAGAIYILVLEPWTPTAKSALRHNTPENLVESNDKNTKATISTRTWGRLRGRNLILSERSWPNEDRKLKIWE